MTGLISIDWDFFFYRACEAEKPQFAKIRGQNVNLFNFFDWGHTEDRSAMLQEILWSVRFAGFKQAGLDPYHVAGTAKEYGCEEPETFLEKLEQKLDLSELQRVAYSDSHRHGYYEVVNAYEENNEPIEVIHFDAHHDLGYALDVIRRHQAAKEYACDDWLLAALNQDMISKLTVVYPMWRGLVEWENTPDEVKEILGPYNIDAVTFDDWFARPANPGFRPYIVQIAKSGAWVPPWFDDRFEKFVQSFHAQMGSSCSECEYGVQDGPHGCEKRDFKEPEIEEMFDGGNHNTAV